jgi:hypothetical protein
MREMTVRPLPRIPNAMPGNLKKRHSGSKLEDFLAEDGMPRGVAQSFKNSMAGRIARTMHEASTDGLNTMNLQP